MEAASGFEPLNKGFADLCLTTWLRRHTVNLLIIIHIFFYLARRDNFPKSLSRFSEIFVILKYQMADRYTNKNQEKLE